MQVDNERHDATHDTTIVLAQLSRLLHRVLFIGFSLYSVLLRALAQVNRFISIIAPARPSTGHRVDCLKRSKVSLALKRVVVALCEDLNSCASPHSLIHLFIYLYLFSCRVVSFRCVHVHIWRPHRARQCPETSLRSVRSNTKERDRKSVHCGTLCVCPL